VEVAPVSDNLHLSREIPVRASVDICVAGGGPAGVAAAVVAARAGGRVLLLEGQNCLGGMGTAGMLPTFMAFADPVHFYAGGFGREVYDRMAADGGFWPGNHWGLYVPQVRIEVLKRLYDALVVEAGVELRLLTQVAGVEARDGRVTHLLCAAKSGLFAVEAAVFIDATGDGDVAAWAGAPFEQGDARGAMMPGTLCTLWADIDWPAAEASGQDREAVMRDVLARHPDFFTTPDPHLVGMLPVGPGIGGGNIGHLFGLDGTDECSMTAALLQARRSFPEYEAFYRRFMTGYARATLIASAGQLGVRETRRILGDYVLNSDDFDARACFPDEIGRYNYWIDRHPEEPSAEKLAAHNARLRAAYAPGDSYGIPYRILTPRGLANVLTAGRCVSTDRNVQASLRVMPGCYITGQAAGLAAVLACETGTDTRGVPVPVLQARLRDIGAFLPLDDGA
jgi:hypothetical protein